MLLETTGRRTGEPRVTPLTFATQGTDFLVVGSNWGQQRQPGWALNLSCDARGRRIAERRRAFRCVPGGWRTRSARRPGRCCIEVWPAYDEYAERVQATSGREIMVFRLERS